MNSEIIENCIKDHAEELGYFELAERNMLQPTIEAVTYGYQNAYVPNALNATAHAVKYIAKDHPGLLNEVWGEVAEADYLAVLCDIITICESEVSRAWTAGEWNVKEVE